MLFSTTPPKGRAIVATLCGLVLAGVGASFLHGSKTEAAERQVGKPNIIVIYADDMGWGDLGSYGNPVIHTPNLDQLAAQGQRWTNFYAPAPICTPSRAGILTGRLAVRSGLETHNPNRGVFFPDSTGGLPQSEITIAEMLKGQGYATLAVGKWHLGHLPDFRPTKQGFDEYLGIPFSNDMNPVGGWSVEKIKTPDYKDFNLPLVHDDAVVEMPVNQTTITQRYTDKTIDFITKQSEEQKPFFVYLAHAMPHVPLFPSEKFKGHSIAGMYGDVVEELDDSVGRIIDTLNKLDIAENTLVVFTSDNGPWLVFGDQGGSAGVFKSGKTTTWEGGMRVPAIFWWPGKIKPEVVMGLGSQLDFFNTFAALSGAEIPHDRVMDGVDLAPVLLEEKDSTRDDIIYYRKHDVYAIRQGAYKAHFITEGEYGKGKREVLEQPLLFNLNKDPGETTNIADEHPEIVQQLRLLAKRHVDSVKPVENQLLKYTEGDNLWKY